MHIRLAHHWFPVCYVPQANMCTETVCMWGDSNLTIPILDTMIGQLPSHSNHKMMAH